MSEYQGICLEESYTVYSVPEDLKINFCIVNIN